MERDVDISVVVCTFNRASTLERALRSLMEIDPCNAFTYEVVAVDDGSTDDTARVLQDLATESPVPLVAVRGSGRGVAAARNAGIAASRGAYIAFFDDDQLADRKWLVELWRVQTAVGADCVGGPRALYFESGDPGPLPEITRRILGEIPVEGNARRYARSDVLCTGNMMLKRTVFEAIGVFDESMLEGGEDTDLFRRMRENAMSCWYTPAALVHHMIPPYRLGRDYLYWTAVRGGRCYAQRDLREWGAMRTIPLALLRLLHGVLTHGSAMGLAVLAGKRSNAVARHCMLARAVAYARAAIAGALTRRGKAPSPEGQFRSERALFANTKQSEG